MLPPRSDSSAHRRGSPRPRCPRRGAELWLCPQAPLCPHLMGPPEPSCSRRPGAAGSGQGLNHLPCTHTEPLISPPCTSLHGEVPTRFPIAVVICQKHFRRRVVCKQRPRARSTELAHFNRGRVLVLLGSRLETKRFKEDCKPDKCAHFFTKQLRCL